MRVADGAWAGRVMYGAGCRGNEIIMTIQGGYATFDWNELHEVSTWPGDGLSNFDVALPGGGALSFTRHAVVVVVVVSGSRLSKLRDRTLEDTPPVRQFPASATSSPTTNATASLIATHGSRSTRERLREARSATCAGRRRRQAPGRG